MSMPACATLRSPRATPASPIVEARLASLFAASRIEVEVDWLPGCRPSRATLDGVQAFVARGAAPRDGVAVLLDEEIREVPGGSAVVTGDALSEGEIRAIEKARRRPPAPGVASLYLLFVSRFPAEETRFRRGVAFPSEGFAVVARDTAREARFFSIGPDEVERFVTVHEVGHLLGLVSDDGHEHLGHCTDPRCILYAGVDLRALVANAWRLFTGRLATRLDPGCEAELARRRAQAASRASRCASETEASPTRACDRATAPSPSIESPTPPPDSAT
jgi:hypothetical protein